MTRVAILICLLCCNILFAQYKGIIKGTVSSRETGKGLTNVNVFISGTTWGTTTDSTGSYIINNLPPGKHSVIASMIGYKPGSLDISLKENTTVEIIFNLTPTSYELKQVDVTAEVPEEWKKNLKEFEKYFLGNSIFATDCKILNPEVINLNRLASGDLQADAAVPVIIINNALGYKIVCNLISFNWNKKNQNLRYFVNSLFTELVDSTGNLKENWVKNRRRAYFGSLTDFIRCLIKDSLYENDFYMWLERKPSSSDDVWPQTEKPEIKVMEDNSIQINFSQYLRVEYNSQNSGVKTSWIKLNHPNVIFDSFGYPVNSFPVEIYGYWTFKGISFMLPKYYYPDEDKN